MFFSYNMDLSQVETHVNIFCDAILLDWEWKMLFTSAVINTSREWKSGKTLTDSWFDLKWKLQRLRQIKGILKCGYYIFKIIWNQMGHISH